MFTIKALYIQHFFPTPITPSFIHLIVTFLSFVFVRYTGTE